MVTFAMGKSRVERQRAKDEYLSFIHTELVIRGTGICKEIQGGLRKVQERQECGKKASGVLHVLIVPHKKGYRIVCCRGSQE